MFETYACLNKDTMRYLRNLCNDITILNKLCRVCRPWLHTEIGNWNELKNFLITQNNGHIFMEVTIEVMKLTTDTQEWRVH